MPKKPVVFGREEGLDQLWGQLVVAHRDPALLADGLDQLAVARIDAQRHLQLDLPKTGHIRQGGPQVDISTDVGEDD